MLYASIPAMEKIRVIDEDGEYQEYKIKGYNIIMRNNIGLNKKKNTGRSLRNAAV